MTLRQADRFLRADLLGDNWRSEKYLAAVRYLPCGNCNRPPPSQPSHSNQSIHGKGGMIKAHDFYVAALCDTCHREIDQGSELDEEHRVALWNRACLRTFGRLFLRGEIVVNAAR